MSRAAYIRALIAAALPPEEVDRGQIRRLLALSPAERIERHERVLEELIPLRGAGRR